MASSVEPAVKVEAPVVARRSRAESAVSSGAATAQSGPANRRSGAQHAWFAEAKLPTSLHDREVLPPGVAEQLLRDEEFQPGARPPSLLAAAGPCPLEAAQAAVPLSRSQRVFKEYLPTRRRSKGMDLWHNASGNRNRKAIPSPECPVLWRRYGAIETAIRNGDGSIARVPTYNFHEYRLAEHEEAGTRSEAAQRQQPVLFHIFIGKKAVKGIADPLGATMTTPPATERQTAAAGRRTTPLLLTAPASTATAAAAHFLSFEKNGRCIGEITQSDAGGIMMQSKAGDIAEWHELEDGEGDLGEGDIVAVVDGRVSRAGTAGARVLGVVSRKAMIEGSAVSLPSDGSGGRRETIAYAGRVPVNVRGPVHEGDRITPSGLEDGTGMRATGWRQPSVGAVLKLGTPPDVAGHIWQVEIAVNPPGFGEDGLARLRQCRRQPSVLLLLLLLLLLVVTVGWSVVYALKVDSSAHVHAQRQQQSPSAAAVVQCDFGGWKTVRNSCSGDSERFEHFLADEDHFWVLDIERNLDAMNLGGTPSKWATGVCDGPSDTGGGGGGATPPQQQQQQQQQGDGQDGSRVSECALALRGFLDSCPEAPITALLNATTAAKVAKKQQHQQQHQQHRVLQEFSRFPCVGASCASTLDLLFARQCLRAAFPDLLSTAMLTSTGTDSGNERHQPGTSTAGSVALFSSPHPDEKTPAEACASAAAAIYRECSDDCSSAECGNSANNQPVTCELARMGEHRLGCDCHCYAQGTRCEAAMAEALRVSTDVAGGCTTAGQGEVADALQREGEQGSDGMPPSAALIVMLYTAHGIREIPVF